MGDVMKIVTKQAKTIDPDSIFGRIDPIASEICLNEMFQMPTHYKKYQKRGSSAHPWNDHSEFATPNIIMKAEKENYVIGAHNMDEITHFNPCTVNQEPAQ